MERKKNWVTAGLLLGGLALIVVPVLLAMDAASKVSIIGGAGAPTFWDKFSTEAGGMYPVLSFFGVIMIIAAVVMAAKKSK